MGTSEFLTKDRLLVGKQERVVLVYPWIYELVEKIERSRVDEHTKALGAIACLEGGFRALLFAKPLV